MHIAPHLFTLTYLSLVHGKEAPTPSPMNHKIVNGDIVENRADFPYQASIRIRITNSHHCGACIIDSKHLLTAAHCLIDENHVVEPSAITVVVGDLNVLLKSATTVTRKVSHIFTHADYHRPSPFENDIALLRVSEDFDDWTANIASINLTRTRPADNTSCTVIGWGATEDSEASDVLRYVSVPIVSASLCREQYPYGIADSMLCAGFPNGEKDSCQGDSGGPIVCNNLLAGIVSNGYGCGEAGYSGIYTDVASYRDWIDEQRARSSAFVPSLGMLSTIYGIISHITLT